MSVKLIYDTDIGSDIDDALALAYLLAQPECELLGVTTVTGEAERRAMMVSALCKIAGKQIPIYPGVERPLLVPTRQPRSPQADALAKWPHDTTFPHAEAIEFLRRTIRAHPGEVTLLATGPMTNIALLFTIDPDIPSLLNRLVLMCGVFDPQWSSREPEWNALNDPHAAEIVFRAPVALHQSVGLDVTTRVTMPVPEFRARCTAPLLQPVLDFASIWSQNYDTITFHDPLAAACVFNSAICTFTSGAVSVELANEKRAGETRWNSADPHPRNQIAFSVEPALFFQEYFHVF
jgi:inosine-uridine nucleoside N-ribohydrolase